MPIYLIERRGVVFVVYNKQKLNRISPTGKCSVVVVSVVANHFVS